MKIAAVAVTLIVASTSFAQSPEWFPFQAKPDAFTADSAIDLRGLNEKLAGDGGFISAKDGQFVHSTTGEPVRFWAVNGCPGNTPAELRHSARVLAKLGVNLVRLHGAMFDDKGDVDPKKVAHAIDTVAALKQEGIYSHFSIYFPLWLNPKPGMAGLEGYNGSQHPFAALYFNPAFQERYRGWWKALLTTPGPDGKNLIDEPAVFGGEIINEDSYFFWTFDPKNVPDAELRIVEAQFGEWLTKKYGSIDTALGKWGGKKNPRDNPGEGRVGFRALWEMFSQKTPRDKDTVVFLVESQRSFYAQTEQYLRSLGFKGLVCGSNWTTADNAILGPLEKYTYTACDFIDRHGYFGGQLKGQDAAWSIRDGYDYTDRDALKFDPEQPGKPRSFVNTIQDVHYDGKPSMVSEIAFNRPNRYRSEAPLYYACYAALQDSNCVVHFAFDSSAYSVKPTYFMQPWTIMAPSTAGQFPAAALIYRKGLVATGEQVVKLNLNLRDLFDLRGTPMPQDAAFDELRAKDVPQGTTVKPGNVIDPLVHYVGRTSVTFGDEPTTTRLDDSVKLIDRGGKTVTSSTSQLKLDYGRGVLTINAPAAQGASGDLKAASNVELKDLSIACDRDLANVVAVALDGKPLSESSRVLLQVMTEDKPTGWEATDAGGGVKHIVHIGRDPWLVRSPGGTVKFKRADAASLKVTALDENGYPGRAVGNAGELSLQPATVYYLIAK